MTNTYGLGIKLKNNLTFHYVIETLQRIGISTKKNGKNTLIQSCFILKKKDEYYIMHFKEMFLLDEIYYLIKAGKADENVTYNELSDIDFKTDLTDDDIERRNMITDRLVEWGLVEVEDPNFSNYPKCDVGKVKILKRDERDDWELTTLYSIGRK